MRIQIRARDVEVTEALRAHVELRLGFALSRFGERIGQVVVHLSNSEESRDSQEKRCRITVGMRRAVKVQETDADVLAAVERAAARAARSVAQAIEQEHAGPESTPRPWIADEPKPRPGSPVVRKREADTEGPSGIKQRRSRAPLGKAQRPQGA